VDAVFKDFKRTPKAWSRYCPSPAFRCRSGNKLIEQTKAILEAEWELTNLGEPVKIIRIEIALGDHSMMISQCCYLESILQKEGMD
jgi:hypothetical protein